MSEEFRRGKRFGPGIYGWKDQLHVDLDEMISGAGGDPKDPHDRANAEAALRRVAGEMGLPISEVEA